MLAKYAPYVWIIYVAPIAIFFLGLWLLLENDPEAQRFRDECRVRKIRGMTAWERKLKGPEFIRHECERELKASRAK